MDFTSWHLPSSSAGGGRKNWRERVFYEKTWKFRDAGKSKTEILPAGNYEYPFDVILEGSMPESVEGLSDTYVTYRFKAEIGRKYAKDIVVRRPLRIIRTLESSALELSHAMVCDSILGMTVTCADNHSLSKISGQTKSSTPSARPPRPSFSARVSGSTSS